MEDLEARFDCLPAEPWDEPARQAMLLPIMHPGRRHPAGVLVLGISPRRAFDDDYRGFFDLVVSHVATAIDNARAYEEEKQRAEHLAALDRAKTAFFSNISHELRTPLTLILGPLEDALAHAGEALPAADRGKSARCPSQRVTVAQAGEYTAGLLPRGSRTPAGQLRTHGSGDVDRQPDQRLCSAIEKAGLELRVDCPPLPAPVYVDREMWEKIVLNLLSNALKFTLYGGIRVMQHLINDRVELTVEDTGVGIPAAELGNVFKRFYRIEGSEGRTHEGTGIGLALVEELVKLHGGTVAARSTPGQGTTFTVSIPLGSAHLPADRLGSERALSSSGIRADAFVEEALRWLPEGEVAPLLPAELEAAAPVAGARPRVLLADDNADMREYVQRLLSAHYAVVAVPDGEAAWSAIRQQRPDLVLSDVMMPRLDGSRTAGTGAPGCRSAHAAGHFALRPRGRRVADRGAGGRG